MSYRFRIGAHPSPDQLAKERNWAMDDFIRQMAIRDWDYVPKYGYKMAGPFIAIEPVTLPKPSRLKAKEIMPHVMQGARYLDDGTENVMTVPLLSETENWEYELAAIFVHRTILTDIPDRHEERL